MDWKSIKQIKGLKSISQIGAATAGGNAIAAFFWIYMADFMGQEDYGELGYLLSIAGIASTISILGGQWTMSVYTAKGIRIESSLYFISIITSTISAAVLYFLFENVGISVYVVGLVVFNLFIAEILGKKQYKKKTEHKIMSGGGEILGSITITIMSSSVQTGTEPRLVDVDQCGRNNQLGLFCCLQ